MDSWQQRFLMRLAETGNVSAAARHAGRPRSYVYDCRRRDAAFGAAWADALEEAADRLELEALRRAVDGVDEDKFFQGAVVGQITRYSDNLLMFLLRARRPALFNRQISGQMTGQMAGQMTGRLQGEAQDDDGADADGDVQIISRLRRRMESLRAPRQPAADRPVPGPDEPRGSSDAAV